MSILEKVCYAELEKQIYMENLLRDGKFNNYISRHEGYGGKIPLAWIKTLVGDGTIRLFDGMTSYSGDTFDTATIAHSLANVNGVQISTATSGANTLLYQETPIIYRMIKNATSISAQIKYTATNIGIFRIGIIFVDVNLADSTEIYSAYNTSTSGTLKFENITIPANTVSVKFKLYVTANNETVYCWDASLVRGANSKESYEIVESVVGIGLPNFLRKLVERRETYGIAIGDSITGLPSFTTNQTFTGEAYINRLFKHVKAADLNTTKLHNYKCGNSSSKEIDSLVMCNDYITARADALVMDLLIMANGRNESTYESYSFVGYPSGFSQWRASCTEAIIRKARTANPDIDIVLMIPAPQLCVNPTTDITGSIYTKDKLLMYQNELLALRYGCTVVNVVDTFNLILNTGRLTDQQLYRDAVHPEYTVGQYIIAQRLIDLVLACNLQKPTSYLKPLVANVPIYAPVADDFTSAFSVNADYASFTHNDFTAITSTITATGQIFDGTIEKKGLENSTQNNYLEFTESNIKKHVIVYYHVKSGAGTLEVFIDTVSVGTLNCGNSFSTPWSCDLNGQKATYEVTAGEHTVKIVNKNGGAVSVWRVGVV